MKSPLDQLQDLVSPSASAMPKRDILFLKNYCQLNFLQKHELLEFKKPLDKELTNLEQELSENGIAKRRIHNTRVVFEKTLNSKSLHVGKENAKSLNKISIEQRVTGIVSLLSDSFLKNSNYSEFQANLYIEHEELIKNYLRRYFEINDSIKELKAKHKDNIKKLETIIEESGHWLVIIRSIYKELEQESRFITKMQLNEDGNFTNAALYKYHKILKENYGIQFLQEELNSPVKKFDDDFGIMKNKIDFSEFIQKDDISSELYDSIDDYINSIHKDDSSDMEIYQ